MDKFRQNYKLKLLAFDFDNMWQRQYRNNEQNSFRIKFCRETVSEDAKSGQRGLNLNNTSVCMAIESHKEMKANTHRFQIKTKMVF